MTHRLYEPKDFTSEQYYEDKGVAVLVIDGGLGICKVCGAAESQLADWPTCQEFRDHLTDETIKDLV